jgi:hypothetical protein
LKRTLFVALGLAVFSAAVAAAESPGGADPQTSVAREDAELRGRLAAAESAYLAADFERALEIAQEIAEAANAEEDAARLARALGVIVQAQYNLGRTDEMDEAIDRLIRAAPLYAFDPAIAGPKLVERLDERRRELVGYAEVGCEPLPCEQVLVDGAPATRDSEGRIAAAEGEHTLVLTRHGFEDHVLESVGFEPGQTIEIVAELIQFARDVRVATEPGGVDVFLDGTLVGTTPASSSGDVAQLVLREIRPGFHAISFVRPCYRKVERRLDVVLDRLDPGPVDLGTVELTRARGFLDIVWDRDEGVLTLDGQPTSPGRRQVCPGRHEVSLSLAGRRAWFVEVGVDEDAELELAPRPRPTIAIVGNAPDGFPGDAWNLLPIGVGEAGAAAGDLLSRVERVLEQSPAPLRPGRRMEPAGGLGDAAARLAPEADLVALWVERQGAVRPVLELALIDPELELLEVAAWGESTETPADAVTVMRWAVPRATAYAGVDLADRRTGMPVVAMVDDDGPAASAGLQPGAILLAVEGEPLSSSSDFVDHLRRMELPGRMALKVSHGGEIRDLELEVRANVAVPTPAEWRGRFLLPALAHAEVDRHAGGGSGRLIGALTSGMILATLGFDELAAVALDRTSFDAAIDPTGDARATVLFVLERLFRRLGNSAYASEVGARWRALVGARYGGRLGPELRNARVESRD